jgi:hypothetical protein
MHDECNGWYSSGKLLESMKCGIGRRIFGGISFEAPEAFKAEAVIVKINLFAGDVIPVLGGFIGSQLPPFWTRAEKKVLPGMVNGIGEGGFPPS